MSYADMAAIMLGAVAVLVTVLGVFIAILALWGYSQFRKTAKIAAVEHIKLELKNGVLGADVEKILLASVTDQLQDGRLRKLLEERVDRLLLTGPEQRAEAERNAADEEKEYGE